METIITQPSAAPVIQSLRNIGYKASTAIADIIDNGIDAGASNIKLEFDYDPMNGFILIYDDGQGMTEEELQCAMTIGSKDPRELRKQKELGRFGMGLKTASFSLGKRLSVISKQNGITSERCWDLDYVSEHNEWHLFREIPNDVKERLNNFDFEQGTIVFIDKLDRFANMGTEKAIRSSSFYNRAFKIKKYLEMVFHVKLEEGLNIYLNDNFLVPWDPYLRNYEKTIEGETQIIRVNGKRVRITPYVLPHPSNFNEEAYKMAGGVKGWRDQQGFYIYREGRLVNYGDWFSLFTKDNFSELVRLKLDFTNDADDDWKIDIKKSSISVPEDAKENLKAIGKYYRQVSKEIMLYKAKPNKRTGRMKGTLHTWELENDEAESSYVINRNHPMLMEILKEITDEQRKKLNYYLKFVELGSPNNLLSNDNLVKKEYAATQEIDDKTKILIIELGKSLVSLNYELDIENIVDSLSMFPGFESVERATLKKIIEGDVISID